MGCEQTTKKSSFMCKECDTRHTRKSKKWKTNRTSRSAKSGGAYHVTEEFGWGVESIMVSDWPVYCRIAISVTIWIQRGGGGDFSSVSLEPRRNWEIGKWYATFRLVRTNRNEQTTSKLTPQFSVGISVKWRYHLPSIWNFRIFCQMVSTPGRKEIEQ